MKQIEVWKRPAFQYRFAKIEIRIGNHDANGNGLTQLIQNRVVGFQDEFDSDLIEIFTIKTRVDGRYLTLQKINGTYPVEVNELFVYV